MVVEYQEIGFMMDKAILVPSFHPSILQSRLLRGYHYSAYNSPSKPAIAVGGGRQKDTDEVVVYGRRNIAICPAISNAMAI